MFEDSLLESGARFKTKRKETTLLSFVLQCALIGVLIIVPLIYTDALPIRVAEFVTLPAVPHSAGPPAAHTPAAIHRQPTQSNMEGTHLITPRRIPLQVAHITEDVAPPTFAPSDGDAVVGSTGPVGNVVGAVPDLLAKNFEAAPKLEIARPTRVSPGVMAGHLVHEVKPVYPHIAIITRVQGSVILHATISKTGYIENLRAVSGPPMLMRAAIDAVQQWRYRPYMLGNEPVEVETQITVNFTLSNSY